MALIVGIRDSTMASRVAMKRQTEPYGFAPSAKGNFCVDENYGNGRENEKMPRETNVIA